MFSYQSTSAKKNSAFFRLEPTSSFFDTSKPSSDALLEGLAIEVDKELEAILSQSKDKVDAKPAKR